MIEHEDDLLGMLPSEIVAESRRLRAENERLRALVHVAIKQRLDHAALDAESLGRILLMLDWLVRSGATDRETVDQILAGRQGSSRDD